VAVSDKIECTLEDWLANGQAILRDRQERGLITTELDLVITDKEPAWNSSGTYPQAAYFWPPPGTLFSLIKYQRRGESAVVPSPPQVIPRHDLPHFVFGGEYKFGSSKESLKLELSKRLIEWARQNRDQTNVIY
jgi:hypothetical protein